MTISYNWLSEYLPVVLEPERLGRILTSIGLEVESLERYEEVKGGFAGLVIGEVLECGKHPNADKLWLTKVSLGQGTPLQIVCGAPNVAVGQKVVVAPIGTTIYPVSGQPLTLKAARIRGIESQGMICAEDEIGRGNDHSGILVLPASAKTGTPLAKYFKVYTDWVFEIGLTPNRMDAMSHLGVARDVCAYLSHHERKDYRVKSPFLNGFKPDNKSLPVSVKLENVSACQRYSGVSIRNVVVKESPDWLKQKLKSIGQRPINNIVDITNFILHETGQPLHAFDADAIAGHKIRVMNLPEGTLFKTLDEKERKLSSADLMICDGGGEGMCIAGVFGGINSGVKTSTRNLFLESAWFNPVDIRRTSFRHGLRTDAAMRFEKNIDISNTVQVLKRAALLIRELAEAEIASDIVDVYPSPVQPEQVNLKFHYLKKLSGKNYHAETVRKILQSLGFEILREDPDDLLVAPPLSKPDIRLPADVVEDIMRIDGLDNIEIPSSITISPSAETAGSKQLWQEKMAAYLLGWGFSEILTNSITNAAYFDEEDLISGVRLLNNLSAEHNIMRPSLLETGLEAIAYNLNRKNTHLRFFEFGKTYSRLSSGEYEEKEGLCLFVTGNLTEPSWKGPARHSDSYYLKGVLAGLLRLAGVSRPLWSPGNSGKLEQVLEVTAWHDKLGETGTVSSQELRRFDIRQPVYYAQLDWEMILRMVENMDLRAMELPRQLPVQRDLALVVPRDLPYSEVEKTVKKARVDKLQEMHLFDIFESEKLGPDRKSFAVSFTFLDPEKTMTEKEIESMMLRIMSGLEKDLGAEIRK